jgi:hypothetical protein
MTGPAARGPAARCPACGHALFVVDEPAWPVRPPAPRAASWSAWWVGLAAAGPSVAVEGGEVAASCFSRCLSSDRHRVPALCVKDGWHVLPTVPLKLV